MIEKLMENRVFRTYRGGARIDRFLGKATAEISHFPEDWTASFTRAFNPGREELVEGYGRTLDGTEIRSLASTAPRCLVKLLDSEERLVIQVHPTKEFAKQFFNSEFGKTECWYFLDCNEDACVYLGFREGITPEAWRGAFDRQDINTMLSMLHRIPVQRGDCVFVGGGVPHAIGKGCFLLEVQEPTDLMGVVERVTPSGRVLPEIKLHGGIGIDQMMKMFSYEGCTKEEIERRFCVQPIEEAPGVLRLIGERCTECFSLVELTSEVIHQPDRATGVIVVTEGEGWLNGVSVKAGDRLFFDAEPTLSLSSTNVCRVLLCC